MVKICPKCDFEPEYGEALFCGKCGSRLEEKSLLEATEEALVNCYYLGFLDGTGLLKKIFKTIKKEKSKEEYLMMKEQIDKLRKGMIDQRKKYGREV